MFGVLLAEDSQGGKHLLKAFSGKLRGSFHHSDWAPPLLELEPTPLEVETKESLSSIKERLLELSSDPAPEDYSRLCSHWQERLEHLREELRKRREQRHQRRDSGEPEALVSAESKEDSRRLREFKASMRAALADSSQKAQAIEGEISELRALRRRLSRTLQAELHNGFSRALWSDRPWSLAALFPSGPPTGTGECCAPKLLNWARQQGLKPLAMAEIWWGPATDNREPGRFYPPCRERCQPLLGALLSSARFQLQVHFEDSHLVALEKPSGLLTVPGREGWNQDSLQLRAERHLGKLFPVHRLDMETSGIVLFARGSRAQALLQKLFAQRRVEKRYLARLQRAPLEEQGEIRLPLARDPGRKGCYLPSPEGKSAVTEYRLLDRAKGLLEFKPLTGRSHQLRIHAASGLGAPILGDRLYGQEASRHRLHLHARHLAFYHPFEEKKVEIWSEAPF